MSHDEEARAKLEDLKRGLRDLLLALEDRMLAAEVRRLERLAVGVEDDLQKGAVDRGYRGGSEGGCYW